MDIIHIHLAWWAELSYSSWALGTIPITKSYILLGLAPTSRRAIYCSAREVPWKCICCSPIKKVTQIYVAKQLLIIVRQCYIYGQYMLPKHINGTR